MAIFIFARTESLWSIGHGAWMGCILEA